VHVQVRVLGKLKKETFMDKRTNEVKHAVSLTASDVSLVRGMPPPSE
jgi:hypothetical protein